ncbi:MAG: ATP-dependent zinc metalloprotease FtsH [Patescibacteria group bacterium]
MNMKKFTKNILIVFLVFVFIAGILSLASTQSPPVKQVSLTELAGQINEGQVEKIIIQQDSLAITLKDGATEKSSKEGGAALTESLSNLGVDKEKLGALKLEYKAPSGTSIFFSSILPFLIPLLLVGVFIYFLMRQVAGANSKAMSFGQSSAKLAGVGGNKKRVTFDDVAGLAEAKQELSEVVEFLRYPQKFLALGARIPKGVLLLGAPGCGKTLLARAVAGEANVPFFHMSGSEFVEMFVGVGASRVRDLFVKAKKHSPSIVFVDEIDAVGRQRGAGLGGGHDEREQTLNQILVEMDGFENETNVIVIAATNRPDVLDPALLRPGRFDRQVVIDAPDIRDREAILKIHSRNKPLAEGVNLRLVAERTPGFSGADLENLVNEAAILVARRNKKTITLSELFEAIEKVMLGPERKGHILSKKEKAIAAHHEAGHALVAAVLPHADPVHKISIISRGRAAGYTLKLPTEDKHLHSRSEFMDDIAVSMGGLAAEKLIFDEMTTGASNDLKIATDLARKMVTTYGMSERLGPMTFGDRHELVFLGREIGEQKNYSEKVATKIDEEVKTLIDNGYKAALDIIRKFKHKLVEIAAKLIKQETIEREEFREMIEDILTPERKKELQNQTANISPAATPAAA